MNEKERIQKVKQGLENDIYKRIEDLETTKHLSKESTEKLAGNLRSYLEGKDLEEEININKELTEVGQHKVQVGSVDEQVLVKEYNNHIYNTLDDDLFEEDDPELEEFIDRTLTEIELMDDDSEEVGEFAKTLGFDTANSDIFDEDNLVSEMENVQETIEIDESDIDIETNILDEKELESYDVEIDEDADTKLLKEDMNLENAFEEEIKEDNISDIEKKKEEVETKRKKKQKEAGIVDSDEEVDKKSIIDILLILAIIIIIVLIIYIFFL